LAVATAAAATLLAAPAFAGVILTKPELKRVFVDDAPAAAAAPQAKAAAAAPKAAKAPKAESFESSEGFSLNAYTVALPGALALLGGGAAIAMKTDPEFLSKGLLKDSNVQGAGYEVILKGGNGGAIAAKVAAKPKAGTKLFGKKK